MIHAPIILYSLLKGTRKWLFSFYLSLKASYLSLKASDPIFASGDSK